MNLVYATLVDPTGSSGQNIYSRSVATALASNPEVDLSLVCPSPGGSLPDRLGDRLTRAEYLPEKRSGNIRWHAEIQFPLARTLSGLHSERPIDGIVTPLRPSLLVPPLFARWKGIPQVVLVEGLVARNAAAQLQVPGVKTFTNAVSMLNASGSAGIYTADEASKDWISSLPGVDAAVDIFAHGIDQTLFDVNERDRCREEIDVDLGRRFTVGFVGSFKKYHCLEPLVDAVAVDGGSDVQLLLVGEGPEHDRIARRVSDLGIGDRVLLPGFVDHEEVADYMGACDVLYGVIAPERSGSPMKVYEYLSCGRPVIVHRSSEFEFVERKRLGEAIDEVTPGAIRAAIERLRDVPPERRTRMQRLAREYVIESGQTWDALAERIVNSIKTAET